MTKLLQDLAQIAELQNQIKDRASRSSDNQLRTWQGLNRRIEKQYLEIVATNDGTISSVEVDALLSVANRAKDLCASLNALRSVRRGAKHPETVALANLLCS